MAVRFLLVLLVALMGGCGESVQESAPAQEVGDLRNEFAKSIEAGDTDAVTALLKEQPLLVNEPNTLNNMPPLHIAASAGDAEIVKLLLESGANKMAVNDEGSYAYDMAVMKGASQEVQELLKVQ